MFRTKRLCRVSLAAFVAWICAPAFCLRTPVPSQSIAFIAISLPSPANLGLFKSNTESFDAVEEEEPENCQDQITDYSGDDTSRGLDAIPPTVNTVTLCGRIGYIDQPVNLGNGFKALRISVATNERGRGGVAKTHWHKVVVYGQGSVDYVHSRARVGDRALVVGGLSYYNPPQAEGSQYKAKIAEVAVRSKGSGHHFILLPKYRPQDGDYGDGIGDDAGYRYNNM